MEWAGFNSSRISRSYYWLFFVFMTALGLVVGTVEAFIPESRATKNFDTIWNAVTAGLGLVFTITRMHDLNKSGWFALLPIYNIIVPLYYKGDGNPNRFGPAPKELPERQEKVVRVLLIIALTLTVLLVGVVLFILTQG